MTEQKELKARYSDILARDVWQRSPDMVDWATKRAAYIVEFENGDIAVIDKPKIETSFYFGYSDSRYDTEDYDRANGMAHHAATNADYFLSENLKDIDKLLHELEHPEADDVRVEFFTFTPYIGQPQNSPLRGVTALRAYDYQYEMSDENKAKYTPLTGTDRARYIEGVKTVREAFMKRLNTYLKKYGLTKVNSWSYWRDA